MKCQVCGSENETGKFCTKCGSPLQSEQVTNSNVYQNQQPTHPDFNPNQEDRNQQPNQGYGNQSNQFQGNPNQQPYGSGYQQQGYSNQPPNEYLEKGKVVSKQYFSFFLNSLKEPVKFGNTVTGVHWINGLITTILSILILSLGAGALVNGAFKKTTSLFGGYSDFGFGDFGNTFSFGSIFFKALLFSAIFAAIMIVVTFGVVKLINGANVSFQDVLARLGSFLTIPAVAMVVFLLFSLLNVGMGLINFLIQVIHISLYIAAILTVISYRTNAKIDIYYSVLITVVVLIIVALVGTDMLLQNVFNDVQNSLNWFNF